MTHLINPSIKLKGQLNKHDYDQINFLKKQCVEKDGVSLKLELDYKLSKAADESEDLNELNEFMCYTEDKLIGYLGISHFGGEALEVNGMVHPDYRRKGIFTKLFTLAKDEWARRDNREMLLLSDHYSPAGLAFIQSMGASYAHSEYDMFLKGEPTIETAKTGLELRKATNDDAEEIARQNHIFFGIEKKELTLPEEEAKRGVASYMAEVDHAVIGKVHLEVTGKTGGVYGLGVLPDYRRNGYGRSILMKAVEKLQEQHVQDVVLQVEANNTHALELYRSCGFEVTSRMDYYKISKN
ncbi:GNAT family N-acetyltransferase [Salipaludibacillus aurantiacus]|uniref:Ribosomal protein S18 acetylase RimI n=1 Tax=Salipaludibacillus aurantiacus TaxID=1601833 RepID=A0A1H9S4Z8_9BACI|nr:GNAT family N-acetyltransferase [Salipaludibacillus aurantiacus]SER80067.1 Ribosomal protein S18 acetylase RimI [Salipaludibacillus aurantiacus]